MNAGELIAFLLALLLAALIVALILRRDFRDALLGGQGEASVLGVLTVKGVAIVLLCSASDRWHPVGSENRETGSPPTATARR